jgi:hypothetical protein
MNFYNIIKEFLGTLLLCLGLLSFNNPIFLGLLYTIILYLTENGSFNPIFTLIRYFAKKDTIIQTILIIFTQIIAGILSCIVFYSVGA